MRVQTEIGNKPECAPRGFRELIFTSAAVAVLALLSPNARGQSVQHLSITQPGGMPGMPVMTGVQQSTNGVTITWDGPSGYYQVFQKQDLANGAWQAATPRTNLARRVTITALYSNAFFRVSGPAPQYAGSAACAECHANIHNTERSTRHAQALEALKQAHQDTNPSCLPCHTVGYGLPSGFVNETKTPGLAGVQCENCHGPAANHAANPDDPTVRPRVELAAQVCGGCHSGDHNPTFGEWKSSGHAEVVEDMNPSSRITSCGRCHSGSARLSLIKGDPPPTGDANVGITCVVCHDPHQTNSNPAQLRYPLSSTNNYTLSTSADFAQAYNPNINVCGQCHNDRGASWTSSSRPPHHSPQYNMLLGSVGVLADGSTPYFPASHATMINNQCVACHMQTQESPVNTGHSFAVTSYEVCKDCHSQPELFVQFTSGAISNEIQQVKTLLDQWAIQKAPPELQSYGTLAWEYDFAGELSSPDGTLRGPVSSSDPTKDQQHFIPTNIQKARFDLYLVLNDGSFGIHNGPFAFTLLETARNWVEQELNQ